MSRFYLILIATGIFRTATAQDFSVNDLLSLSALPQQKFEQVIGKKGFSKIDMTYRNDAVANVYQYKVKNAGGPRRYAEKYLHGKDEIMIYSTSSTNEAVWLTHHLKKEGFFCGTDQDSLPGASLIYQRTSITVSTGKILEPQDTLYTFRIHHKTLPPPSRIHVAEDLLQFDAHQHLVSMFGAKNVIRDVYYYSDDEISSCSVIFPRTSRQAVFIWKDETNLTDLAAVVIGGGIRVGSDLEQVAQVSENSWSLSNGIHPNMKLIELLRMNESDFFIYGKGSPYFLKVVPQKTGALDFAESTIVMSCLNCSGTSNLNGESVSAEKLIDANMAMHVMMVILTPGTRRQEGTLGR